MAMNRAGLKSLMGYENGGGVTNEEQTTNTNQNITLGQEGISALLLQALNPSNIDVGEKAQEYQGMLSEALKPPRRASFYDLASDIGAGLLLQPSQEKMPSIGRGIGLGFQSFKKELDAKTKAFDEKLDNLAVQSVNLAIGDKQKAEQNYNSLLYKELLDSINPDKGTAVTYAKEGEDGNISYKTFGSKEVDKIAQATKDGYTEVTQPMVQIGTKKTGLEEFYDSLGRAAGKQEETYQQDYELANKSNELLDQMEKYGAEIPEEAFGLAPLVFEDINRFIISFPGLRDLPIADGLRNIQSKREPMASVTVNLAMMNVQKTKGPISDTEMRLFISSIPSLAQTKQGYYNTIAIMRDINNFIIRFETARQIERDKYLQNKNASVSGLQAHMTKWETAWRRKNKAFTDEQIEMFKDKAIETQENPDRQKLAEEALSYFDLNSNPVQTPSGSQSSLSDLSEDELEKLLQETD